MTTGFVVTDADNTALSGTAFHELDRLLYACYTDTALVTAWDPTNGMRVTASDINGRASGAAGFIDVAISGDNVYLLAADGTIHLFTAGDYVSDITYFADRNDTVRAIRTRSDILFVLITNPNPRIEQYRTAAVALSEAPRERTTARSTELVRQVTDRVIESAGTGVELPARDWEGSIRDALRRVTDSEYGRFIDGRLYAYSTPRNNLATNQPLSLRIMRDQLTVSESVEQSDDWIINVVHVIAADGSSQTVRDRNLVAQQGEKPLTVPTDLGVTAARALAERFLAKWKSIVQIIDITLDGFFERDTVADRMLGAAPHTVIELAIGQNDGQYLVLSRQLKLFLVGSSVRAALTLRLIAASQWDVDVTAAGFRRLTLNGRYLTLNDRYLRLGV